MKAPHFSPFAITRKTLFSESPGKLAVLVTVENDKTRSEPMEFENAQAALAWCESNGASFVYLPAENFRKN